MIKAAGKSRTLRNQAIAFHESGNLADAERLYLQFLDEDRSDFPILNLLGMLRWQQGRNSEALGLIESALKICPRDVEALSNCALVLNGIGRPNDALARFDEALAIQPNNVEVWNNRGIVLQQLMRFDEALISCERALTIKPDDILALNNRGLALYQLNFFDRALASYDKALTIEPNFTQALSNRGIALRSLKRFDEAVASYDRAIAIRPDYVQALNNRGLALHDLGRFEEALVSFDEALSFVPNFVLAVNNRGVTLRCLNRMEEALASYDRALNIMPDYPEALFNRGNVLQILGRFDEALASYEKALTVRPDYFEALNHRGVVLLELNRVEEALNSYDRALAIKSDNSEALNNRGNALIILGRLEEARGAYDHSLRLKPSPLVYNNYAISVRFTPDDPHFLAMQAMRNDNQELTDTEQLQLDFALAKAFDDLDDPARSFPHLMSGNALRRAQIAYDEASEFKMFDRIEAVFTPRLMHEKQQLAGGNPIPIPIFILGMTRSGSTLVEQILASHPQVYGAGEMGTLTKQMASMRGRNDTIMPFPDFVPDLDGDALRSLSNSYLQDIRRPAPTAFRITDKMPANFLFCGIIHLMLPNARIIHTVRDPVDTCFSSFSKLFTEGQYHTFDLRELGRYYLRYRKLMEHWHRVLPPGRILNVHYENVVADLEGQARRIIAHCGLEWRDQCVAFHTTKRPVKTFSHSQVRQPIYRNAVGRSHKYQEFLGPLIRTLESENP